MCKNQSTIKREIPIGDLVINNSLIGPLMINSMRKFYSYCNVILRILTVVILSMFLSFCGSLKIDQPKEHSVEVKVENTTLKIGDSLTLNPSFIPNLKPTRTYDWSISNPEVVELKTLEDYSAIIVAKEKGTCIVSLSSSDGEVFTSFRIVAYGDGNDGVLKVLAIGNSFSMDAVENYLFDLAAAENIPIVIGNLYRAGASLEQHWNHAQENLEVYEYRKISVDGNMTNTPHTTIEFAVQDENWDYISFQQVSGNSGKYETYLKPLPALMEYVQERSTNHEVKYILHQTWAYSKDATHKHFSNYENDQETMYSAIVNTIRKVKMKFGFDFIIPAGTAIQNGRNTILGGNFTRDGYHLDFGIGRYTAACTWFQALTKINVVGNSFKPNELSVLEAKIAQHSAHFAILNPDSVSPLSINEIENQSR